jgi:hypothetical protein
MQNTFHNRLYDKYLDLSYLIEKLKYLKKQERDKIISALKDLIMDYDNDFIGKHVLEFPLPNRRRWYDEDPLSWMVIHVLKYAEEDLLNKVNDFLKSNLP